MYAAEPDRYCYPGTDVLKNIPGIHDQAALSDFEAISSTQRSEEPLPNGHLSITHYRAIHHHLLQDVYSWAGKFRTVRIGKGGNMFCYPENISREMRTLFSGLKARQFLCNVSMDQFIEGSAHFLATLNAIHPFREGNGRSQTIFLTLVAAHAGYPFDLQKLVPNAFLAAMIASFHGDEGPLRTEIGRLVD
jgi:cell filamentation protein